MKHILKELDGLLICDLARFLFVLMRFVIRLLRKGKLARGAGIAKKDIETYVEICEVMETLKVSSLDPQIITSSGHTENRLYSLETSVEYPEDYFSDRSKIASFWKGIESRQFGTTSSNDCHDDHC